MGCKQCKVILLKRSRNSEHHATNQNINVNSFIQQQQPQSMVISEHVSGVDLSRTDSDVTLSSVNKSNGNAENKEHSSTYRTNLSTISREDLRIHVEMTPRIPTNYRSFTFTSDVDLSEWTISNRRSSLEMLPVELVYRILDELDACNIFMSLYNVCNHLNLVLSTYHKYDLNFTSISKVHFHRICSLVRPDQVVSLTLNETEVNVGLVELFLQKCQLENFTRLRHLTLIGIDDDEEITKLLVSITDNLVSLSIDHAMETYTDTVIDILMFLIEKNSLHKLHLNIKPSRTMDSPLPWPTQCFLRELKLVGFCSLSHFRTILNSSINLEIFEAYDIDFDDEWDNMNDDNEQQQQQQPILPIPNAPRLTSLSFMCARNDLEQLEWLLPQLSALNHFKFLSALDSQAESILEGDRWEMLLSNVEQFAFIFIVRLQAYDWNAHNCLATFETPFWIQKQWNIVLEQHDKIVTLYSLPYCDFSYDYDNCTLPSMSNNSIILNNSMQNVSQLRLNIPALDNRRNQTRHVCYFSHVTHLILDGLWTTDESTNAIASLVHLPNIVEMTRHERVPTLIFDAFIDCLPNLHSLTLTTCFLDSMNAAKFQYARCLRSLNVVQSDDSRRQYVNVEPFCTMFPRIEHLNIPIDNLENCQYVIDELERDLVSVTFRFLIDDDDDDDEDDEDLHIELLEWARNVQEHHRYRVCKGNIHLWLQ